VTGRRRAGVSHVLQLQELNPDGSTVTKNRDIIIIFSTSRITLLIGMAPNIICQKLPAPQFTVTTKMDASNLKEQEKAGLVMMGMVYASLTLSPAKDGFKLQRAVCKDAQLGGSEKIEKEINLETGRLLLKAEFTKDGKCLFRYSISGDDYSNIGQPFQVREGKWIGAKVGLFAVSKQETV
jgi:hypothetical protein